jgi:UDP:flavonoid glycosyltransferase YjiC (YdhE family)
MTRVIMAAIPFPGHVNPLLPIAQSLVAHGYDVTFLTGSVFEESVTATGAKFRSLRGPADFNGSRILENVPSLKLAEPGVELNTVYVRDVMIPPIAAQYEVAQELLAEGDPDTTVFLHDPFFHGLWPVLLGADGLRPAGDIGLGVSVLMLSSDDTAPFGLGLPPASSEEDRELNRKLNEQIQRDFAPVQERLNSCLAELGAVRRAPYYWDAHALLSDFTLQLSLRGMEYPRSNLPAHIDFIGRVKEGENAIDLPDWWQEVVDAERVVFVSQGTVANDDITELIGPTVEALADHEVLVVVTMGGTPLPDSVPMPANARVTSYVPYHAVLPHADVFVTNGGFGGIQIALSFGVPMVIAGETEEKKETAMRVEQTGVGVNLRTGRPRPDAIRAAVDKVLHNGSFHDNARKLQHEHAQCNPMKSISEMIGHLVANPRNGAGAPTSPADGGAR